VVEPTNRGNVAHAKLRLAQRVEDLEPGVVGQIGHGLAHAGEAARQRPQFVDLVSVYAFDLAYGRVGHHAHGASCTLK